MLSSLTTGIRRGIRNFHLAAFNRGFPTRVAVYFHSIEPAQYQRFREMVAFFRERDFEFADPNDFLKRTDRPAIFISFDDAYRAWYEALPFFRSLDVPLTFYVNTVCLREQASEEEIARYFDRLEFNGRRVALSSEEILELHRAGFRIGAHTHSHFRLTSIPLDRAKADIRRNKDMLESLLGEDVEHFSFPFGMRRHFDVDLSRYCRELGFKTIATGIPGMQHGRCTPFHLHRSGWDLERPLSFNLENLCIDGRVFERLTGRSAVHF